MNKLVCVMGAALLLSCAVCLEAGKRRGAEILVSTKDGQQKAGELITVKASSLLLLDSQTGADDSVEIGDIAVVKIIKESKALAAGVVGFGVGALLGLVLAGLIDSMPETHISVGATVGSAALVGAVGAVPGALIGAWLGADQTIQLEDKSPEEVKAILGKLRRQARIPDFT